jgi:hypothetical protein
MMERLKRLLPSVVCLLVLLVNQGVGAVSAQQPAGRNNRVRIYNSFGVQQDSNISTQGPSRVVTGPNSIVVIDDDDRRVRIYNTFGALQNGEIHTSSRADVIINGNLIPIIEDSQVRIFTLFGFQQGAGISTNSRADVVAMGNTFIVIEESRVRIFDLFGNPTGQTISTNSRARVTTGNTRFAVIEDERVRIYDLLGNLQGSAINTDGPAHVAANGNLFIVADDTRLRFYTLFGNPQGSPINTNGRAKIALTTDRIVASDETTVRILRGSDGGPVKDIATTGPSRVATTITSIVVIDDNGRRVRIFDLSGQPLRSAIDTNSRADVVVTVNNRLVIIEDNKVTIYDAFGSPQGGVIGTNGRADIATAVDKVFVVDNASLRIYSHFGLQQGAAIGTSGRASVITTVASVGVADDSRVRIYNHSGVQQGNTISTVGRVSLATASDRIVVIDAQDEAPAGLTATNDGPTALGKATTLMAHITAGTNVTYTWDFGDGSGGAGQVATHTYQQVGDYTATVTARNSAGTAIANTIVSVVADAPANNAQFIAQSVPSKMETGQTATVSITMKNTGTTTWTAAGDYKLGSQNPKDNILWTGSSRLPLDASDAIAPGQQKTFGFDITAPSVPGTYNFQWRMLQEGVVPEEFGNFTPNVAIEVTSPLPGPPPALWEDDHFDNLALGPLDGQNGWHKAAPDRASAVVVQENVANKILQVQADPGATIVMGKDVPRQVDGRHAFTFRVRVTGATLPSLAKIEVRTNPGAGWDKKFQLYFGSSMRVNYGPTSPQAALFVPADQMIMGHWYHVRVEMDLALEQIDIWVDNQLAVSHIPMHPGPITDLGISGWDRPGFVELDNIIGMRLGDTGPGPGTCSLAAVSSFDTDDEGWKVIGDAQHNSTQPDYMPGGGNPSGYVSATDDVAGGTWYWEAPQKFLGDQSAAYNGVLAFDLKQSDTSSQFDAHDVILTSDQFELALIFDTPNNPGTDWTSYSIPLNETAGWLLEGSGEAPTQDQMQRLLSALTGLRIRGEYRNGPDTGGLDNVVLGLSECPAQEPEAHWINPAGGTWADEDNWSIGAIPGPSNHAFVTLGGNYSVIVDSPRVIGSLTLGAPLGRQRVVLDGTDLAELEVRNSLFNAGTIVLAGGVAGESPHPAPSSLRVVNGSLMNHGVIAVTRDGGGDRNIEANLINYGTINANHYLYFGGTLTNYNTLNITFDNRVVLGGATQTFNQNGGTILGSGRLALSNGATFNFNGGTLLGTQAHLSNANLNFGPSAFGAASFVMTGGDNRLSGNLGRGHSLAINGGGGADSVVTAPTGFTSAGTIYLDSQGGSGGASLAVSSGTMINTGGIHANRGSGGNRSIRGNLVNQGLLNLDLADGQELGVLGTSFQNASGGIIQGSGTLNVSSTAFNNAGHISPGGSPGILHITGDFSQAPTGVLDIEVSGLTPGAEFDQLEVSGTVTLTGTLSISLTGGFEPALGDSFEILTFSARSGDFATFEGLGIGPDRHFEPVYTQHALTIQVVEGPLGPGLDHLIFLPIILR